MPKFTALAARRMAGVTSSGEMPKLTFTSGNATREVNSIYFVTSQDAETGDIIVKIVNAGEEAVKFNVSLADLEGVELTGIAEVFSVVGSSYEDTNDIGFNTVAPINSYKIGFSDGVFGYEVDPLSVTAFRVRTK